jgi:hypothetical protein
MLEALIILYTTVLFAILAIAFPLGLVLCAYIGIQAFRGKLDD